MTLAKALHQLSRYTGKQFENTVGKKKGELWWCFWGEVQVRVFVSGACYSRTFVLVALFMELLPAVQICCWEPTGAIHTQSLAELSHHLFLPLFLSPFSQVTLQTSMAFCFPPGKKDSLSAPEAYFHARLFRRTYFIIAQGSAPQLDVNLQAVWNSKALCWFMQLRSWPRSWYSAHLTSDMKLVPLHRVREALNRGGPEAEEVHLAAAWRAERFFSITTWWMKTDLLETAFVILLQMG